MSDDFYIRNGKQIKKATAAEPITNKSDLYEISRAFEKGYTKKEGKKEKHYKPHPKYRMLWELSIGLGFRISDTLTLTVEEVTEQDTEKEEKKTGKKRPVILNARLQGLVNDYIKEFKLKPEDKLIFSNNKSKNGGEIDRSQAYRKLKEVVNTVCPKIRFSNHTCRKTWAYFLYLKEGKNITIVQKALNHTSSLTTCDYIGLSKKELKEKLTDFDPLA